MKIHQKFIHRCLYLAKNAFGNTYPNPMVGCVIVSDNKIIGEGWHKKAGEPHAEVNAIAAVADKSLLKKATLYVNLEPCAHYGKTPPCADLIVKYGIPRVVIGALDTNKLVSGRGVSHLKENGCKVIVGVLVKACLDLNKRFYTYHNKQRPYIILKWATSLDGFIAPNDLPQQKRTPVFLTNTYALQLVHQWRAEEQAIFVGTQTAVADNPKLDVRHIKGSNPIRVVLDSSLRIPKDSYLFDESVMTIVLTDLKTKVPESRPNLKYVPVDFSKHLPQQVCAVLFKEAVQSVIIEGGSVTLQSFIDDNLWDEARVFKSRVLLERGIKEPNIHGREIANQKIGDNRLIFIQNEAR